MCSIYKNGKEQIISDIFEIFADQCKIYKIDKPVLSDAKVNDFMTPPIIDLINFLANAWYKDVDKFTDEMKNKTISQFAEIIWLYALSRRLSLKIP